MAIDTAKKRKSIVSVGFMPIGPGLVIDGTVDAGDRQAIGYSYAGTLEASLSAGFIVAESFVIRTAKASGVIRTAKADAIITV